MNKYKTVVSISLVVVFLDQITKMLIRASLALHETVPIFPFLDITHLRNRGAAFGIMNDLPETIRMPLFVLILVVAFIAILAFVKKAEPRDRILILLQALFLKKVSYTATKAQRHKEGR